MLKNESSQSTATINSKNDSSITLKLAVIQWGISFLLILSQGQFPNEVVRLIDSRAEIELADKLWTVPIGQFAIADLFVEVPYVLFAMLGAGLLVTLASLMTSTVPPSAVIAALTGLSVGFEPEWFVFAALCVGSVAVTKTCWMNSTQKLLSLFALLFASLFVTLEFGLFVLCVCLLILPGVLKNSTWNKRIFSVAGVLLLLVPGIWQPGYTSTFFRFINWINVPFRSMLLPSTQSLLNINQMTFSTLVMAISLLLLLIVAARKSDNILPACVIVPLGVLCTHYLWPILLAIYLNFRNPYDTKSWSRIDRLTAIAAMCIAFVVNLPQWPMYTEIALGESVEIKRLNPVDWNCGGKVLLMNLESSQHWQLKDLRKKYRLIMNDRWEVGGHIIVEYAILCQDLSEGRAGSYLRSDLGWGGYAGTLKEIAPAMLVISSENLLEIRRLSLSPHWRILGVDADQTYFGYAENQRILPQGRKAIQLLTHLEWPRGKVDSLPENSIVAASWEDSLQVSRVLCAIRFPYAALRFLPPTDTEDSRLSRAWCWLEIAHRVHRHTGQVSLIDQYRALASFRDALHNKNLTSSELRAMSISANVIGADELAAELAQASLEKSPQFYVDDSFKVQTQELISRFKVAALSAANQIESEGNPETKIRLLIQAGNYVDAQRQLSNLPETHRAYYELIISSPEQTAGDLYFTLSELIENQQIPQTLLAEAQFYQGCIGLEAGDTFAAVSALQSSQMIEPNSPFEPLRTMYLHQLGNP